ncbi:MAG: AtpZ/AtpI family protein [Flavobacteriaceae bacterium]|nr:AtpZ/AtpI family protein [Flavobacteriaceae bacterium]
MPKKLPKQNPNFRRFAQFSGLAIQMGVTFYLAVYFGKKIDAYFQNEKKIATLLLVILATVASIVSILQQLKRMQK